MARFFANYIDNSDIWFPLQEDSPDIWQYSDLTAQPFEPRPEYLNLQEELETTLTESEYIQLGTTKPSGEFVSASEEEKMQMLLATINSTEAETVQTGERNIVRKYKDFGFPIAQGLGLHDIVDYRIMAIEVEALNNPDAASSERFIFHVIRVSIEGVMSVNDLFEDLQWTTPSTQKPQTQRSF